MTKGGGRYFLETKSLLIDKLGKERLKVGDLIEYYVEVAAENHLGLRKPDQMPPPSVLGDWRVAPDHDVHAIPGVGGKHPEGGGKIKELYKEQTGIGAAFGPK